ncbi:glycerol kinase GlpK [Candidatus Palauibacter sp.]|uniref:glycerol kinase GlpK n=1 Tax=Candidatus Palauibacter sp. TaxID=3101350 RepID=UPI003C6FAE71
MRRGPALVAIDQGTTSTRAIAFDLSGKPVATAQRELPQSYPAPGWVEHDPERIRDDAIEVTREVIGAAEALGHPVEAIGLTNQRETTVVWERASGRPIHPAIVWQDRRTADACAELREAGHEERVARHTGLRLDPYFSGTKLAWILDRVPGARDAAVRGELAFGTIDSWLLWCLTGGRVHATDATNASRTLLYDIGEGEWRGELLELLRVPAAVLPEVRDSAGDFGETRADLFGRPIPVRGIAGDQQAATFGQAAFEPGGMKFTYGTGAFALLNTGSERLTSQHGLLTTVAWQLGGERTYALEGSIFVAGASVQWLRDGLGIISDAAETEVLARSVDSTGGVVLVPAFVGLGGIHWDPGARAALLGMTRDTGRAEIARAALEAVAYQSRELIDAMQADGAPRPRRLRVDGGFTRNAWAMQFLADMLDLEIARPAVTETTALGAAMLAGLGAGLFADLPGVAALRRHDRAWTPAMEPGVREELYAGWQRAVARVLPN